MAIEKSEAYVGQILRSDATVMGKCLVQVEKINPKNIKVSTETGVFWSVPPRWLSTVSASEAASFTHKSSVPGSSSPKFTLGSIVRLRMGRAGAYYVLLGQTKGTWRIAKLGGDGGKYIRGVDEKFLELVPFEVSE